MKPKTDALSIPAGASVKIRAIVTAGLANDVEEVKKYAANIQSGISFHALFSFDVSAR
jgi:hypothetical protein